MDDNPTAHVVALLPAQVAATPLPAGATLASCTVLPVDAAAVSAVLSAWPPAAGAARTVFVHLGVHCTATELTIERRAYNQAAFRVADEAGWLPPEDTRVVESHELGAALVSRLPVEELLERALRRGCAACLSDDPGRFLCNYSYYLSLAAAASDTRRDALFVHCPPATACPVEQQCVAVYHILRDLAQLLLLADGNGSARGESPCAG